MGKPAIMLLMGRPSTAAVQLALSLGEVRIACFWRPDEAKEPWLPPEAPRNVIQVWDDAMEETDFIGRSAVWSGVVKKWGDYEGALLLCVDKEHTLAGATAERLDLPHLGRVTSVEVGADKQLTIARAWGRVRQTFTAPLPIVLELEDPGKPAGAEGLVAPTLEAWSLEDLGLTAAELSWRSIFVATLSAPENRPPAAKLSVEELVARAVDEEWIGAAGGTKS